VVEPRAGPVRGALARLLADAPARAAMAAAARERAVRDFSHDVLAAKIAPVVRGDLSSFGLLEAVA
jgi:hypothetical protein